MGDPHPIIVVTGANSGIGFGICLRLLLQLSLADPPDAHPQYALASKATVNDIGGTAPTLPCNGLTLIMACRSLDKAEVARKELYHLLDLDIAKQKKRPGYDGHAATFRQNLRIEIHYLDLAMASSVFKFGDELRQKYPYISHLICNAGVINLTGIDWALCVKEMLMDPILAVTDPSFYKQAVGEVSSDGLGWVWQCNVFGHYMLYRTLQPLLAIVPHPISQSRVIWMSTIKPEPFNDPEDYQLLKTNHSYESSKYQTELLASYFCRQSHERIRHFVVQPGVVHTNISAAALGWFTEALKVLTFYVVRFLGSLNHNITPLNGAFSAVHLSLVSLSVVRLYISSFTSASHHPDGSAPSQSPESDAFSSVLCSPVKFCSQTDRWGNPRTGISEVKGWHEKEMEESEKLADRCERLYNCFLVADGRMLKEP